MQKNRLKTLNLRSKISIFGYAFLCLNFFFFSCLLVANNERYATLTLEDSWVEYLGCLLLFLTGLLLLSLVRQEKQELSSPRWLYLFFGCAFVWAAGEELSWGQRIFGFETPDFLRGMNSQNELNLHNIKKMFFDRLYNRATVILYMTTSIGALIQKRYAPEDSPALSRLDVLLYLNVELSTPWQGVGTGLFSSWLSRPTRLRCLRVPLSAEDSVFSLCSHHSL